ncbi:type IV secretory system conjugative DNA transfer family protein [Neorhizobium sp. T786]|uniref:type IV secretory system conjugative DNA transfer family protein n=1 Tax=Pseudorhizobium xiangyangii TaxID=2883104 RepID=UPI001D000776|nr:type IV secretory system conjugative DNA transfer family protein [Neorhizobium xiangyangii]MCB5205175.1 type IV secretory system conjugative DNA transfer family protein [Neorhizobium xiangyangii]
MTHQSTGTKFLILAAVIGVLMLICIFASNFALLMLGKHDGSMHWFTVIELFNATDRSSQSWAMMSTITGLIIVFFTVGSIFKKRSQSLHGEARWATDKEIKQGGFLAQKGIIVGRHKGKYLVFGGSEHVMVYAPTRGGKGVGIVVPNCLHWSGSAVVLDLKKENWKFTAGYRKSLGHQVFMFDPLETEGLTVRYNPLAYVDRSNPIDLYDDLQRIGAMLLPVQQHGDAFWTRAARTGFLAIAGYIAETPELPFTIGEVYRQLSISADLKTYFLEVIEQREEAGQPLSQQCVTAMNDFLAASDNTFQSVRKTISAQLELWNNARIDQATSGNDFDLREFRRRRQTLYIGASPDNLARMAPLYNLLFQQVVDLNTRTLPEDDESLKHQIMLMLDEFPAIGNVEVIQKGVSYVAGYGIRLVTILQSPSQLYGVYGEHEARNYMTNHAVEVVFTPKELAVSKELSERFGTNTVKSRSVSKGIGFKATSTNKSQSESDQARPLMLPQELVLTPFEQEYIIKGGMRPISCEKIQYWKEPAFTVRLLKAPDVVPIEMGADGEPARAARLATRNSIKKAIAEGKGRKATVSDLEAVQSGQAHIVAEEDFLTLEDVEIARANSPDPEHATLIASLIADLSNLSN